MRRGARRCAASGGRDEGESLFGRRTGVGREAWGVRRGAWAPGPRVGRRVGPWFPLRAARSGSGPGASSGARHGRAVLAAWGGQVRGGERGAARRELPARAGLQRAGA